MQRQAPISQSDYQRSLDQGTPAPRLTSETVRYWSDYNRVFYHPRSIVQLNEYELNSQIMPFEDWNLGGELFNDLDKEHDLLDRDVRTFAEECDQLRALQIFTGADDAWGGFAARYIDRLRDEYGKKSIWVWAIEDGNKAQQVCLASQSIRKPMSTHRTVSSVFKSKKISIRPCRYAQFRHNLLFTCQSLTFHINYLDIFMWIVIQNGKGQLSSVLLSRR